MAEEEFHFHLTPGSRYLVRSFLTREKILETEGTFRGVTGVGSGDGIIMELPVAEGQEKGMLRVIPTHMVVAIDVIESVKKAEEKGRGDENLHYI